MIVDTGKHYLYRHTRYDTGEPLYVGIGTKDNNINFRILKTEYKRAYSKTCRSKFWKNIVVKTDYEVEILLESNDYQFIKQKEIEFIALYGRVNLNTGILCNLTDGGEGTKGIVVTEDFRIKRSEAMKGDKNTFYGKQHTDETKKIISEIVRKPFSEEGKQAMSQLMKGRVVSDDERNNRYSEGNLITKSCIHIKTLKEFNSLADGCRHFNIPYLSERGKVLKNTSTKSFEYLTNSIRGMEFTCYDEETLNKYKSLAEACRDLDIDYDKIRKKYKKGNSRIKSIVYLNK